MSELTKKALLKELKKVPPKELKKLFKRYIEEQGGGAGVGMIIGGTLGAFIGGPVGAVVGGLLGGGMGGNDDDVKKDVANIKVAKGKNKAEKIPKDFVEWVAELKEKGEWL